MQKNLSLVLSVMFALILGLSLSQASPVQAGQKANYKPFFGDLHNHTSYSDGWEGTPTDAYASAIAGGADFFATTDHAYMLSPEEWEDSLQAAQDFTKKDFVAMAAYEYWMPGYGEIAVYNVADFPSIHPNLQPQRKLSRWEVPAAFFDWLADRENGVGLFVHPTDYGDNFDDFAYWNEDRDAAMGMLEVHNLGSWEMPYQLLDYEASYVMALDNGWHVMPVANSDTHSPNWIQGYEVRTVLLAKSLTLENLIDAMRASRGYATMDKNLRIEFILDGAVMGETLPKITGSHEAHLRIEDPDGEPGDNITLVEILSDGGQVVASQAFNSTKVEWHVTLTSDTAHYYFARVTTASNVSGGEGITAWTAPVWTGR
ncbi:MAG TPA: hypothetical protein DCY42_03655 [Chloroflexi bacterium]|nr:hypothetical protein [Chloroflexota bacterium]